MHRDQAVLMQQQSPSLPLCILVEPRLRARREIVQDLEELGLFSVVAESRSLEHGRKRLIREGADGCFLGPSLEPSVVEQFIRVNSSGETSARCGYFAVVDESTPAEEYTNADAVVYRPYDVDELRELVTKVITRVNPESDFAKAYHGAGIEPETRSSDRREEETAPSLESIAKGFRSGKYAMLSNGTPSLDTRNALDEVIAQLLSPKTLSDTALEEVRTLLRNALNDWFTEMALGSETRATRVLREQLGKLL